MILKALNSRMLQIIITAILSVFVVVFVAADSQAHALFSHHRRVSGAFVLCMHCNFLNHGPLLLPS